MNLVDKYRTEAIILAPSIERLGNTQTKHGELFRYQLEVRCSDFMITSLPSTLNLKILIEQTISRYDEY